MGGNYQKDLYKQLMDVMAKVDSLDISEGSAYNFCRSFSSKCSQACSVIENDLLNSTEICTDATTVSTNGKQTYIRNFSAESSVL